MTKSEVLSAAKRQMALDLACAQSDFDKEDNTVVRYKKLPGSSSVRDGGYFFRMITFGGGVCVSADRTIKFWCDNYFSRKKGINCFEFPELLEIDNFLRGYFHVLSANTEMYLPDPEFIREINPPSGMPDGFRLKWFEQGEIPVLYGDMRFVNSVLCEKNPKRPDMLSVAAYDDSEIIGLAGAVYDSETFWQIGVDVILPYQKRGLGEFLVSGLTEEILRRGKLPCYGTWCSNIASRRLTQKCGYFPAWVSMHAVP